MSNQTIISIVLDQEGQAQIFASLENAKYSVKKTMDASPEDIDLIKSVLARAQEAGFVHMEGPVGFDQEGVLTHGSGLGGIYEELQAKLLGHGSSPVAVDLSHDQAWALNWMLKANLLEARMVVDPKSTFKDQILERLGVAKDEDPWVGYRCLMKDGVVPFFKNRIVWIEKTLQKLTYEYETPYFLRNDGNDESHRGDGLAGSRRDLRTPDFPRVPRDPERAKAKHCQRHQAGS